MAIHSKLNEMHGKGDFFTLGKAAGAVAEATIQYAQKSPGADSDMVSVVIMDRTMDLVAPLMHADHLLEQMYHTLPRVSPQSIDVLVYSTSLESDATLQRVDELVSSCTLSHAADQESMHMLEELVVSANQKDAASALRYAL
jgi:hypothetical protein